MYGLYPHDERWRINLALIVGLVCGLAGLWGVTALKRMLRVDDPCDVFGVHGVCGIIGCILTGIFPSPSLRGVGFASRGPLGVMPTLSSCTST